MTENILEQKIAAMKRYARLKNEEIDKFRDTIKAMTEWELFRINPLRFADEYGFEKNTSIELFVYAAKVGIFDFSWDLICPGCGAIEYSYSTFNNIKKENFHCTPCNVDIKADLDDQVEVAFTINESILNLSIDPFADKETFTRYFYTKNYQPDENLREYRKSSWKSFDVVEPDEHLIIPIEMNEGDIYRFLNVQIHTEFVVKISDTKSDIPQVVEVDLFNDGFIPGEVVLQAGLVKVYIKNKTKSTQAVGTIKADLELQQKMYKTCPFTRFEYLTGKMLFNNQSFRELFRIQSLNNDLKLSLRSLTIMFTDLKGSTEMYEKTGDYNAYSLVQDHFKILTECVRKYNGAIVKTMGDAIMATFSQPIDGVMSAYEMLKKISESEEKWRELGQEIGLKIGLNEGTAIVVNADERLDFFGQNVNIAARVQGLASSGEIWITETVYGGDGVENYIVASGAEIEKQAAMLKGVGKPVIVYKLEFGK